ncbi:MULTISPECIES: DeoR/GlpR family DNA-binding transcription regulator [Enorma]|uniref:DeoR/GlpR family DNA-binding transcription regulator n=1 Tax=Enorma TaxID=1472762 RepID=UPI0003463FD1|nr:MULTISPECIES: DeoR/GlpR family DNA-binding transcription regulator [Enorma]
MIPYERQQLVLQHLSESDLLKIEDLQELLPDTSVSTLRRDLKELEKQGRVEMLAGGAVRLNAVSHELGVMVTGALHAAEKERMAQRALEEVSDGDTVYLDSGTSCTALLRHLIDRDVTIYTANGSACYITGDMRAQVIIIGGAYNPRTLSMTGPITEGILKDLYFDKAFLGVNAVSIDRGVTNPSHDEAIKKQLVKENSNRTYILCDSSKFHRVSNVRVFGLDGLSIISETGDDQLGRYVEILTPDN